MTEQEILKCKCQICKKQYKTFNGFCTHINATHHLTLAQYLKQFLDRPICKYCNKNLCEIATSRPKFYYNRNHRFTKLHCSNKKCYSAFFAQVQHANWDNNTQLKNHQRNCRVKYLQQKTGKTAWERRQNREMSYLERWFYDNIIIQYNLTQQYDIVNEFCEFPYFIDFAFINIKVAIELDGKCHFIHGTKRLQHDYIKDEYLINHGWTIIRIKYTEINTITIQNILSKLKSFNLLPKIFIDSKVYSYQEYKKIIKSI